MKIRFSTLTASSTSAYIKEEKLFHQTILRLSHASLTILLTLITAGNVLAQAEEDDYVPSHLGPFEFQQRTDNPLREPFNFNYRPAPTALDIDNDGDTDVVVADYDGGNGFHLLRNDGTPTSPAFNRAQYLANPFGYIAFDDGGTLTFTDIDTDGDLDMLFGTIDGTFRFYKRTNPTGLAWTIQNTAWNATTKSGNPMYGIDLGDFTSPVFNDMDNDGDLDLV
ncbi:MAG TPA: FG-GAP-like repeat-containing protein, partial [Sphingobacteriaceae bacterium]